MAVTVTDSSPSQITFTVLGVARPKGSMTGFVPKGWTRPILTDSNKRVKPWAAEVKAAAADAVGSSAPLMVGPVKLALIFYLPCPKSAPKRRPVWPAKKPDVDKLARAIADALKGVVWVDDAQITTLVARKCYAGRQDDQSARGLPRVEVAVAYDRDDWSLPVDLL